MLQSQKMLDSPFSGAQFNYRKRVHRPHASCLARQISPSAHRSRQKGHLACRSSRLALQEGTMDNSASVHFLSSPKAAAQRPWNNPSNS